MRNQSEKKNSNKTIINRNNSNIFMTPRDELDIKINESSNIISNEKVIIGMNFWNRICI